jgi:polar amino acid transport system substrate-binding protein
MAKKPFAYLLILVTGLALASPSLCAGENDRLMKVLEQGKLVVGVKVDYKPWGFRDVSGQIVGMEPDMAQDVADALAVALELVPVTSENRMRFLQQGKIDLIIATMSDVAKRRKVVGIVEPNYYSSGTNVMSPKKLRLKTWRSLKGRPVCGVQGAFYNRIVEERYSARVIPFATVDEVLQTLRDGRCIAFVFDSALLIRHLASGDYDDYEMPFRSEDETPWVVAVPLAELDNLWGRFMSGMLYWWHTSGRLIELEEKWGIPPTDYLEEQKRKHKPNRSHLK